MLNRRRSGISNFFKHRKTNSLSEGMNDVVKIIKNAYGCMIGSISDSRSSAGAESRGESTDRD